MLTHACIQASKDQEGKREGDDFVSKHVLDVKQGTKTHCAEALSSEHKPR
jgi:hypothetical protein